MHVHSVENTQAALDRLKHMLPRNKNAAHERECWGKRDKLCFKTESNQVTDD